MTIRRLSTAHGACSAVFSSLRLKGAAVAVSVCLMILLVACTSDGATTKACVDADRQLRLGFYAHFAPVSYSSGGESGSVGFDVHQGYEADLLTALEAMDGVGVSFSRRGIGVWDDIWLASAGSEFDVIGGGITI